jgi:hypothetical protein
VADQAWRNLQLANPAETFWRFYGTPLRGEYGGRCNNALCNCTGADWYNKGSGKYYCDDCARRINESCLEQSRSKLCELHI